MIIIRLVVVTSMVTIAIGCTSASKEPEAAPRAPVVCAIDPPDGEAGISAAIAACPNGSTVRFPPNRTYHQANAIRIDDRHDLTIDGNGSTFISSSISKSVNGNWVVLRGTNIRFQNMTVQGAFDWAVPIVDGKPKYTIDYPPGVGWETNSAFAFYGTNGGGVRDATARNVWGDGVLTAFDGILDAVVPQANWQVARNLVIERILVENASRVCLAPVQGINNTFKDSTFRHCWTWGVDAEADADHDGNLHNALPIDGVRLLNNTFEGFNYGSIAAPVGGDADTIVGNIEIRGNRILTTPTVQLCAPSILIGAYYENVRNRFRNIVIEDNMILSFTRAVVLHHVTDGSVRNNEIRFDDLDLAAPDPKVQCSAPPEISPIVVVDSTNVLVANNALR